LAVNGRSKARILVVDDDEDVRSRMRRLLASLDAVVEESASAEDAMVEIARAEWDLVLLDVQLPGMDGLTALPQIGHLRPTLPVVIVSGMPADPYAQVARERGAAHYLGKDRIAEQLLDVVRGLLHGTKVR
jgi:CheY-like chemotaxis protein